MPLSESESGYPTCAQAAAIAMEASQDPGWGMFVWLTMVTGVRHDRLCDLRWGHIDLDAGVLSFGRDAVIEVDPRSVTLLRAYLSHCAAQAIILDIERHPNGFVFSISPDGRTAPEPEAIQRRYAEMCQRHGWNLQLDRPGSYSVDELVAGGADLRAFTWRLQRGLSRIQRRPRSTLGGSTP